MRSGPPVGHPARQRDAQVGEPEQPGVDVERDVEPGRRGRVDVRHRPLERVGRGARSGHDVRDLERARRRGSRSRAPRRPPPRRGRPCCGCGWRTAGDRRATGSHSSTSSSRSAAPSMGYSSPSTARSRPASRPASRCQRMAARSAGVAMAPGSAMATQTQRAVRDEGGHVDGRPRRVDGVEVAARCPTSRCAPRGRSRRCCRRAAPGGRSGAGPCPQLPTISVVTPWAPRCAAAGSVDERQVGVAVDVDEPGGHDASPVASIRRAPSMRDRSGAMATIRSSRMPTSARTPGAPVPSTSQPPRDDDRGAVGRGLRETVSAARDS